MRKQLLPVLLPTIACKSAAILVSALLMISCQNSPRLVPGTLDHPFSERMFPSAQDVGDAESAERSKGLGAIDYFTKPVDHQQLTHRISSVLSGTE